MIEREFLPPQAHAQAADRAVSTLVAYAARHVPYYRQLLRQFGFGPDRIRGVQDLPLLPALTKAEIQNDPNSFRSEWLPPGERVSAVMRSSGTTGQPLSIAHTRRSRLAFAGLKQRELRWLRVDPMKVCAYVRAAVDLPRTSGNRLLERGETHRAQGWMFVREMFQTGPLVAFGDFNDIDEQLAWLRREQPHYLVSNAAHLEHLALAAGLSGPIPGLHVATAVSQQLTPEMRERIERSFDIPVHQNYGLNEIGIVATRCAHDRYHVHAEHCVVEIVNEDGQLCRPGERGRVLVTGLSNLAMPLLRYDADDLAVAADGPCPCGRTLPGFAEIIGRYRRTALLPPGTWGYWEALLEALHRTLPASLTGGMRKYQLHQFKDRHFELRLVMGNGPSDELAAAILAEWRKHAGPDGHALVIRCVDDIPRPRGGKFQNFSSDFVPAFDPLAGAVESP